MRPVCGRAASADVMAFLSNGGGFGLDDPLVVHAVYAWPPAPAAVAARNVRRLKADPVNVAIPMIVIVLV